MTFEKMEQALRQRLEALRRRHGPNLSTSFRLPDLDRADAIGTYWGHPETRTSGELLIDLEEDRAAKA